MQVTTDSTADPGEGTSLMIPICEPLLSTDDVEFVQECLRTGWISSSGRFIEQFEEKWAAYCGMIHGVAVSNGTAALQIAVDMLDLEPGDEVILPAFTLIACAQPIVGNGAVPVLVDSDASNWQMDVNQVRARITNRTRAILVVHTYGHPADMDPILELARGHGLAVVEDAAEVHGAEYKGRKCGGFGDLSIFSFYANKLITTGEGGMVLTDSDELAARARSLRNLCFQSSRRFLHDSLGYNFRLTNMQAALGASQVDRIDSIVDGKRRIAHAYTERLSGLEGIALPVEETWAKNVYWVYGIVLDGRTGLTAEQMARHLADAGVETRPFFLGMHEQPVFRKLGLFADERYPVAERLARQGLYLPNGLTLQEWEIDKVCEAVRSALTAGGS